MAASLGSMSFGYRFSLRRIIVSLLTPLSTIQSCCPERGRYEQGFKSRSRPLYRVRAQMIS